MRVGCGGFVTIEAFTRSYYIIIMMVGMEGMELSKDGRGGPGLAGLDGGSAEIRKGERDCLREVEVGIGAG